MRFSVSRSPSPVQRTIRRPTNSYSVHNVTDSEESEESSSDESEPDAPVLAFSCAGRDTSISLSRALTHSNPERTTDAFLAAVKLRARPDPVEEYQKSERALLKSSGAPTATPHLATQAQLLHDAHAAKQAQRNAEEMETVVKALAQLDVQRAGRSEMEARKVKESVRGMWEGIEGAIRRDEEIRRKAEEEKRRTEEEQKRKEEEQKRKIEEERAKVEADKKKKEDEERAKKAAQEATVKAQAEKEAAAKALEEKTKKENEEKAAKAKAEGAAKAVAARTAGSGQQEWENAWAERASLKSVSRALEENAELKSLAGKARRKLRTRVGQADAIHEILSPTPAHPTPVYTALLSALCKYLLLQAETEVTAKLPTAYPLGRLVWMVISRGHERLPHVFFARLVGRTGGWACGCALARKAGTTDTEWRKMIGLELEGKNDPDDKPPTLETSAQYADRLVGQLALYASILQSPLPTSLPYVATPNPASTTTASIPSAFRLPRLWTLLARTLNSPELLSQAPAPQVLSVLLEVAGDRLNEVYGGQFKKLMGVVEEAVKAGVGGEGEIPARVRLSLLVERWGREGSFGLEGRELAA
ncbi:hypothetical protein FRC09_009203 [Ceratobasidium sp. 395]|nr:hypothetical protein FRC09_009203 [Ceratobasidium sp. 395]